MRHDHRLYNAATFANSGDNIMKKSRYRRLRKVAVYTGVQRRIGWGQSGRFNRTSFFIGKVLIMVNSIVKH
jgi:hypothetical protein